MIKLIFDKNNKYWVDNLEYNNLYLISTKTYYKDALKVDGIILLKELIKSLGFKPEDFCVNDLIKYWIYGQVEEIPMEFKCISEKDKSYEITLKFREDLENEQSI